MVGFNLNKKKKITLITGGTGGFNIARLLRLAGVTERCDVTAVVAMSDHGGYSGTIRDKLHTFPPGDLLKLLLALSTWSEEIAEKWYHRFSDNSVPGSDVLVSLAQRNGLLRAIAEMEDWLECEGKVLPVTLDEANLVAETNKRIIQGEGNIEHWFYEQKTKNKGEKLLRVFLRPHCHLLRQAGIAIKKSDLVVIGPGSFYTSLIAALKVQGMAEALQKVKKLAYVVNVTTHPKETPGWAVSDFVKELEIHIRRPVDYVLCNKKLPKHLLESYGKEFSAPVKIDVPIAWNGREVIVKQFVSKEAPEARQDQYLAETIEALLE